MPSKNEKIKLYIVLGLVCAAGLVAYFHFFHQTRDPAPPTALQPPEITETKVARTYKIDPQQLIKKSEKQAQGFLVSDIRDIFESPPPPPGMKLRVKERPGHSAASSKVVPDDISLELSGTIIGGNKPMAIINEKFVRLGETVDIFRVTHIAANEVVLKAGIHERILRVLKTEEHLQ